MAITLCRRIRTTRPLRPLKPLELHRLRKGIAESGVDGSGSFSMNVNPMRSAAAATAPSTLEMTRMNALSTQAAPSLATPTRKSGTDLGRTHSSSSNSAKHAYSAKREDELSM